MNKADDSTNIRKRSWARFLLTLAGIIVLASFSMLLNLRLDLTGDKRYTLSPQTKKILSGLRNDIFVQVYLDGEMPIPMKRLRRSVKEMLDEFAIISGRKLDYEFINPSEGDERKRNSLYNSLISKGINPVNIRAGDDEGGSVTKLIFPGMIINHDGTEVPVNFLRNNTAVSYEENILSSIEGLEYELIQTISTLSSDTVRKIAFIEGHSEFPEISVASATLSLARFFTVDRGSPGSEPGLLDPYAAIVIAGPEQSFSETEKLIVDQYIMQGGKVLWLLEEVRVNSDSLFTGETIALYQPLGLEDQLFRYGARINPAIIQDIECAPLRLSVRSGTGNSQIVPFLWYYFPRLRANSAHPVTRNINRVKGQYSNYIDTVGLDPAIRKTVLLETSDRTRIINPPFIIRLKDAEKLPDEGSFSRSRLPVAVLLEGVFPSSFRNRMVSNLVSDRSFRIKPESTPTKMIVVADADIIRNEVIREGSTAMPVPLGMDRASGVTYGNNDFIVNCVNYLTDEHGLLELRSREMKLRLLNRGKIRNEKVKWQVINIISPVLLVILSGMIFGWLRRKKYSGISS